MKKSLVNKILQIGIVVKDVEKSVQTWEEVYGIGPWQVFGEEASGAVTEMKVWGEYKNYSAKVAMCNVADVEIELLQPTDDISDYARFLKEHGEGIHHLAVEEDKPAFNKLMEARHIPEITSGVIAGFGKYMYFDTRDDLGFIAETYDLDKA